MEMEDSKRKVLSETLAKIEKQFGKGTIQKLGKNASIEKIPVIHSGSLSLDNILGVGGIPKGRIIEIFGPEASGKSSLALHIIKEAQKEGGVAAFIDMEHAMSLNYASDIGVNIDDLIFSQPDYGEQALEMVDMLASSGTVSIIVVDSVSALVPKAELEGEMGDSHMGLQARLMGQALRKLTGTANKTSTTIIFINQLRQKIGVMFGNPEITSGGNALKFYASVRIDIRRIAFIKNEKGEVSGSKNKVKIIKNKVAIPFKETEISIIFGKGIDVNQDIFDLSISLGIIKRTGSWFTYGDDRFQGASSLIDMISKDEVLRQVLSTQILEKLKNPSSVILEDNTAEETIE